MNKRILNTVEDLDTVLLELDSAAEASDDELRRVFKTFSMEYPGDLDRDPYSSEYKAAQTALYERLSGKTYSPENEVSAFDGKLPMSLPSQSKPTKQAGKDHEVKHGHRGYVFGLATLIPLTFRR